MKRIIDYLPVLSICLLYFGYIHLYSFYNEFNVEIHSFITSTDIVLLFFPKIVSLSSFFSSLLIGNLVATIRKPIITKQIESETQVPSPNKLGQWLKKYAFILIVTVYMVLHLMLLIILMKVFHYQSYELADLKIFLNFLFIAVVFIALGISDKVPILIENMIWVVLFLIIWSGIQIGNYGGDEARKIKAGLKETSRNQITFDYNSKLVTTTDSFIYIGQTSSYMFLYKLRDSSTHVYSFDKIDNLQIK